VIPDTAYALTTDGVYLAYQIIGDGPIDVLYQPDWPGNIDMEWEFPSSRTYIEGMASVGRVIMHDHRGVGLSSRNVQVPNLETRVADALAVLDAAGSTRAVLTGVLASGAVNALLAVTRPERAASLVWIYPTPRTAWAPDNPWGRRPDDLAGELEDLRLWGTLAYGRAFAEDQSSNGNVFPDVETALMAKASRNACTPDVAAELAKIWYETDVRAILPAITTPTLLIAQTVVGANDEARHVASLIPNSEVRFVDGDAWAVTTIESILEEIHRFLGVHRPPTELDTILSTVLFTDVVESSTVQARLGDHAWKSLIERHHATIRQVLERWQGLENDTAGDGFYATFEGPARAIRAGLEIVARVRELGIEVRAGVHTGECEIIDGKIGGIGVSIGARVAAHASASQVLVTQTVKDLVAGSRLRFTDAGERQLKGIPGVWRLHSAAGE
jgi:class 3 adenylate cyclase/pimeloyl-ACP methyl ester carboxylesterase